MLNQKGERELAYIVKIDDVISTGIEGVNNVLAVVGGWKVFVRPDDFHKGDLALYVEIDSLCPDTPVFHFLYESGKYRIKTQRYIKGKVLSQGLLLPISALNLNHEVKEGDFLTDELGIVYYEPDDNERKGKTRTATDKGDNIKKNHPVLSKFKILIPMLKIIDKKRKAQWPSWVIKSDEERIQNQSWRFSIDFDKPFIATEKIDGTSTTFTMRRGLFSKMIVCSRNIVISDDNNVYSEMAKKYNMATMLKNILKDNKRWEYVTVQGETFGGNIQKRDYGDEHRLAVFNIIYKPKGGVNTRLNPIQMHDFIEKYGLNGLIGVPILDEYYKLPSTCDEILRFATGESKIDGKEREGIVFRSYDGKDSFKAVSNEYLEKYHRC